VSRQWLKKLAVVTRMSADATYKGYPVKQQRQTIKNELKKIAAVVRTKVAKDINTKIKTLRAENAKVFAVAVNSPKTVSTAVKRLKLKLRQINKAREHTSLIKITSSLKLTAYKNPVVRSIRKGIASAERGTRKGFAAVKRSTRKGFVTAKRGTRKGIAAVKWSARKGIASVKRNTRKGIAAVKRSTSTTKARTTSRRKTRSGTNNHARIIAKHKRQTKTLKKVVHKLKKRNSFMGKLVNKFRRKMSKLQREYRASHNPRSRLRVVHGKSTSNVVRFRRPATSTNYAKQRRAG
jgi:hypothetical protein